MLSDANYHGILDSVLKELRPVIEPSLHDAAMGAQMFERVLGVPFNSKGINVDKVKGFVEGVCKKNGMDVRMIPCRKVENPIPPPLGSSFVSWLVYSGVGASGDKEIDILYHVDMAHNYFGKTDERGNSVDFTWTNRCISLILLHECCHALHHLKVLMTPIAAQFDSKGERSLLPSVKPNHEQEAWAFALFAWAILVGDFSAATRAQAPESEKGWQVA